LSRLKIGATRFIPLKLLNTYSGLMNSILELVKRFDAGLCDLIPAPPRPTLSSIARINAHFGITLPADMIEFALSSKGFGHWFASLGPDEQSRNHIIRVNSYWRRRRRTRAIPRHLVVINIGFDDDLDCLDLSAFDACSGEYPIRYWSPGTPNDGLPSLSFRSYLEHQITGWERARRHRLL
jgi:hypothetical protein